MRILIVDDDRSLAQLVGRALESDGFAVQVAHTLQSGSSLLWEHGADLLVLDLEFGREPGAEPPPQHEAAGRVEPGNHYRSAHGPRHSPEHSLEPTLGEPPEDRSPDRHASSPLRTAAGLQLLAEVERAMPMCPVLVLSAAADTATRAACLDLGAADCLRKPFSLKELRARVRALLRRQQHFKTLAEGISVAASSGLLTAGELLVDRFTREVSVGGMVCRLTPREFAILEQLVLAEGAVVPRDAFRSADAGNHAANALDVHIVSLRRKLSVSPAAPRVETARGLGYRLVPGPSLLPRDGSVPAAHSDLRSASEWAQAAPGVRP